jgi:hypothetical protein
MRRPASQLPTRPNQRPRSACYSVGPSPDGLLFPVARAPVAGGRRQVLFFTDISSPADAHHQRLRHFHSALSGHLLKCPGSDRSSTAQAIVLTDTHVFAAGLVPPRTRRAPTTIKGHHLGVGPHDAGNEISDGLFPLTLSRERDVVRSIALSKASQKAETER